ncbi:MAG: hydrogen peroxide-inducible genes activator [Halieaceae bacterium]|nr:MAG: hydrogen peroxide-inducible genes activator [Halieaceae bacterium]
MSGLERLTFKQIRYFQAIAEAGSFRRAADRLGVKQPTLTVQIAALEAALATTLFERHRSGVVLTPAARELLPRARRIAEEMKGFTDQALGVSGQSTYRLGVTPTLGPYLLPRVLPAVHQRFEDLRLYVREAIPAQLASDLKSAAHDVVLTTLPLQGDELEVIPLFRESLKLALPLEHPLASKGVVSGEDLVGEAVLTIDEQHLYHRQVSALCESLGATVNRDYEGTSLDTLRQMVVMGMGITFLPSLYVASEIGESDTLRITDVKGVNMNRDHALAWRRRSPARVFFRQLAEAMKAILDEQLAGEVILL